MGGQRAQAALDLVEGRPSRASARRTTTAGSSCCASVPAPRSRRRGCRPSSPVSASTSPPSPGASAHVDVTLHMWWGHRRCSSRRRARRPGRPHSGSSSTSPTPRTGSARCSSFVRPRAPGLERHRRLRRCLSRPPLGFTASCPRLPRIAARSARLPPRDGPRPRALVRLRLGDVARPRQRPVHPHRHLPARARRRRLQRAALARRLPGGVSRPLTRPRQLRGAAQARRLGELLQSPRTASCSSGSSNCAVRPRADHLQSCSTSRCAVTDEAHGRPRGPPRTLGASHLMYRAPAIGRGPAGHRAGRVAGAAVGNIALTSDDAVDLR